MARPTKLLDRMRRSKAGWKEKDLHRLYTGFGFSAEEGSKHRLHKHPQFLDLRATVTRSSHVPERYVVTAIHLTDTLLEREALHGQ